MNPLLLIVVISLGLVAGTTWLLLRLMKPFDRFTVWTKAGGEYVYKIKRQMDAFLWSFPDDKERKVLFPIVPTFGRSGRKGTCYTGDADTGLLLKWDHHKKGWIEVDGEVVAAKLCDGREKKIARGSGDDKYAWAQQYVLPVLIVVLIVVLVIAYMVYQYSKKHTGA